jgi:5-hydroxyisourate hydrolase
LTTFKDTSTSTQPSDINILNCPKISRMPPRTPVPIQLSTLATHLSSPRSQMSAPRPPITCHVLDTTVGLPGQNIPVKLSITAGELSTTMIGLTNSDGRVTLWEGPIDLQSIFQQHAGDMACMLTFETAQYWEEKGIKPFFPTVQVAFVTTGFSGLDAAQSKPHWHVPVLLGPFNYTTYRGS